MPQDFTMGKIAALILPIIGEQNKIGGKHKEWYIDFKTQILSLLKLICKTIRRN